MKNLTLAVILVALSLSAPHTFAQVQNVKFGILRLMPDGNYRMDAETTRIPRRLKDSGFRFGVAFSNPGGKTIEWYELVHLSMELQQLTGGLQRVRPKVIQSDTQRSNQKEVVDHFWFDPGDPLGRHRLELYVDGVRRFSVDFDVFDANSSSGSK